jgi:Skp family chaperone for outer membrane proteins
MRYRFTPFAFAICATLPLLTLAQPGKTPDRPAAQAPASSQNAPGVIGATGKIAVINTAAFRVGIGELKAKLEALDKEFEPKNKELEGLQKQLNDLKTRLAAPNPSADPSARNKLMDQGAELEKALQRKSEDYQALFQKRGQEVVSPIMDKINKFLDQYSKQNDIVLVLDHQAARSSGVLAWAKQDLEITEDFMKAYNKANPTPAAPQK